jgi:hypothetical protein
MVGGLSLAQPVTRIKTDHVKDSQRIFPTRFILKMSAWKLVEAVAEESPAKPNNDQQGGRGTAGKQLRLTSDVLEEIYQYF